MKFSPDAPDALKQVNDLLSYVSKGGDNISLTPDQILANYRIIDDLEKKNQTTIFSSNSAMDDLYAVAYAAGASKYLLSEGILQKTDQGYSFHVEDPDTFHKLMEKLQISQPYKLTSVAVDPQPVPTNNNMWYVIGGIILALVLMIGGYEYYKRTRNNE
jgi:hypothetical protein